MGMQIKRNFSSSKQGYFKDANKQTITMHRDQLTAEQ